MVTSTRLFELESINFDRFQRKSHSAEWTLRTGEFRKVLLDDHSHLLLTSLLEAEISSEVIEIH
jgi:hypothetical protein